MNIRIIKHSNSFFGTISRAELPIYKGAEIGRLLEVDYSTVSQCRKRLRDKLEER